MEQFECLVYLMFEFASYFHSDYKDLTSCTSVMCSRFFKTLLSLFLQMNSTRYNLMKALGRTKVFSLSRCFFLAMILVFMRGRRTTLHLLGLIHLIIHFPVNEWPLQQQWWAEETLTGDGWGKFWFPNGSIEVWFPFISISFVVH